MSNLVLASTSRSRARLLEAAGVAFTMCPPEVDESLLMDQMAKDDAKAVALLLAQRKALSVSRRFPGSVVLGGDSVIEFETEKLSKCTTRDQARALLEKLCGKSHLLVSAAALVRDQVLLWRHASGVRMEMRAFSAQFLNQYLEHEGEAILSSVGCYHLEGRGAQLFDAVAGDYFSVLGLPLLPVLAQLRKEGVLPS